MNTTTHTPGPWAAFVGSSFKDLNAYEICKAEPTRLGDHQPIARSHGDIIGLTPAEAEANARLIAAAPEMYEALLAAEAALAVTGRYIPTGNKAALETVRAALAKVRPG